MSYWATVPPRAPNSRLRANIDAVMKVIDEVHVGAKLLAALRSQWWSSERIRDYQGRALVGMMRHAVANVPFYRKLNLHVGMIQTAADLQRFPVIGKQDIQREPDAFVAAGLDPAELYTSRTSGSSGQPTTTYFDRQAWLLTKYSLKMRRIVATDGLPLLKRVLIISEQAPELLGASAISAPSGLGVFFRQLRLSIHTPIEQHLAVFARYRPHIVYAFPSYLLDLIATAELHALALPRIETLYTSSEVLTPTARDRIEKAFAGRLHDVYGSTEFKEVAWQCRARRYHINFESVYVEAQAVGSRAPVILSTLCNYAMPLLRFDIGDKASFGDEACPCGRAAPHMLEFVGREGDAITLPSGRRLSPYLLTTVIESESSILQYRIFQTEPKAFRIDVIVRSAGQSTSWQHKICAELGRVIGEPAHFKVREVDALERAPSGKRSVFVRVHGSVN
jgi:phenylacetate-CoA ligase